VTEPTTKYPLLMTLDNPGELRQCDEEQLQQVCDETRQFLIDTVSKIGGHLACLGYWSPSLPSQNTHWPT